MNSDGKRDSSNEATEALSPASEQRDVGPLFLANFVHQVVNPINGVIGTLDNITDGTYGGTTVIQKINASRAQLEQCVTLIRNLAYLSDFFFETSGKEALRQPRQGGVSIIPQVVIEALQFFQIAAEKRGIRFHVNDTTQYRILVRPELLKQVFLNLFDNWLKYGAHNQTINIEPKTNRKGELTVEMEGESIGFKNNEAESLFDLGFRSDAAQNKVAQGSGIGLYICRKIMTDVVLGNITAEHNTKTGKSKFRLTIPQIKWQP
ncbi:HAMP domain-containing sensor histidine kinase [Variovorax sp. J22R133]|uniref:sensor histidine kinase n=1 Tax=Variovorax brevis TaxID=3053503 RepID=UPI002576CA7E|nr:HAMP domain-containing sensor histidine kinase [Variovorax sp. J22R133]MDM0113520.1 HAMP domain-containing sensor histidine kinase [Variovorax sp. J22R133]